jgi:hypothetical protein
MPNGPLIYWEEASADDIEELKEAAQAAKNGAKKGTPEEFMALVPNQGRIPKNDYSPPHEIAQVREANCAGYMHIPS